MKLDDKNYFRTYDVIIVSSGGCGCTYINQEIQKHIPSTNPVDNSDNLKHLFCPSSHLLNYNKVDKIIFVYNDPLLAIISHFKRGWAVMQHKQICPINKHIDYNLLNSIDSYFAHVLKTKRDGFGIIDHAKRWLKCKKSIFVDLRDIVGTQEKISNYLNIPIKLDLRSRNSTYENIPEGVFKIYKNLDNLILKKAKKYHRK